MIVYVTGANRRSKVLNIIIRLIIKMATRCLRTRNLPISRIDTSRKLRGGIDEKSDLDMLLFMPVFCLGKAVDGIILLTAHIDLDRILLLTLTLIFCFDLLSRFFTLTSTNFLSRFSIKIFSQFQKSTFPLPPIAILTGGIVLTLTACHILTYHIPSHTIEGHTGIPDRIPCQGNRRFITYQSHTRHTRPRKFF